MAGRQVRIAPRLGSNQRRVFQQDLIRRMAASDPQLVLALLEPAQRRRRAVDLEPQIVLVTGTDLADGHAALHAVVEPHEHHREIFAGDHDRFAMARAAA